MDASSSSSDSLEALPLPLPPKSPRHTSHKTHKLRIPSTVHRSDRHSSSETTRSSTDRHSKRRSKDGSHTTSRELIRLLEFENREVRELQRMLLTVTEQLKSERRRADECDRRALDFAHKYRNAENARVLSEQNVSRTNEELRLYKVQLDNAQKEIFRAQEVLSRVDQDRHDAEEDAARARTTARRLKEEKLIQDALEDGRRLGMEEGIARGRDLGYQEGRAAGYEQGRSRAEHVMERFLYDADMHMGDGVGGSEQEYNHDEHDRMTMGSPIPETPMGFTPRAHVPPDNWIPERDVDSVIRLPPPHEMAGIPASMTPASPPLPPLPAVPEEDEDISQSPIMIPAPQPQYYEQPRRPIHRRSSSIGSDDSTRTSELGLLSNPRGFQGQGERLSVIQEASLENTPSQRTMRTATASTPQVHRQSSIRDSIHSKPPPMPVPPPSMPVPQKNVPMPTPHPSEMRTTDYYRRPRSPDEEDMRDARRRSLGKSRGANVRRSRSDSSLGSVPDININPPSSSNSSRGHSREGLNNSAHLLSPQDANRSLPPTSRARGRLSQQAPAPPPPILRYPSSSGPANATQFPPGFVPTSPSVSEAQLGPSRQARDGRADPSLPPGFVPTTPSVSDAQLGPSRQARDGRADPSLPPGFVPTTPSVSAAQLGPSRQAKDGRADPSLPPGFVPTTPSVPETQLGGSRPPKDNRNDSSLPPGFVATTPAAPASRSLRDTPRARTSTYPAPPPPVLNTPRGARTSTYAGQDPHAPGSRSSRAYPSGPSVPGTPAAGARRTSGIYNSNPPPPAGIYAPNNPPPPGGPYTHGNLSFPALHDQYMSLSSQGAPHRELDEDPAPLTMPVIPPPSAAYDDDVESTSSSGSANTLSTPPPKRRPPMSRQSSSYLSARHSANTEGALPVPPPGSTPRAGYSRANAGATPGMSNTPLSNEHGLSNSASRQSLRTTKSHKHFDKDAYVDPAFLASNSAENLSDIGRSSSRR